MNKLLRNTLVISSFWVFVLILGIIYIYGFQRNSRNKLQNEKQIKSKQLSELNVLKNDLSQLQNYYSRLHNLSLKYKGTLASFVLPGETFDYIRRELQSTRSTVKLNMDYIKEESFQSVIKRTYEMRGTGKFVDIYNFLWFLENGPVFYSIESITINKIEKSNVADKNFSNTDEAGFNFSMIGYDRTEGPKITEINRDFGQPKQVANIFNHKNIIKYNKPKPVKKQFAARTEPKARVKTIEKPKKLVNSQGLPEISSDCKVLAITPFSIMLKDERGKIIKLRKGDKIFGGNLAALNTQTGQATFKYDKNFGNKFFVLTFKK